MLPATKSLKVAAACVHLDSWELLRLNIANLIGLGVREFFLLNHNSKVDLNHELVSEFGHLVKFHFYFKRSPAFFQSAMTTYLRNEAKSKGVELLIIFDADEFIYLRDEKSKFVEVLSQELKGKSFLSVPVTNYFQEISRDFLSLESLSYFRPELTAGTFEIFKTSFLGKEIKVFLAPLNKVIHNISRARLSTPVITGNHYGLGRSPQSRFIGIAHLPYAEIKSIRQRGAHGANLALASSSSTIGVNERKLRDATDREIIDFWKRHSYSISSDSSQGIQVKLDDLSILKIHRNIARVIDKASLPARKAATKRAFCIEDITDEVDKLSTLSASYFAIRVASGLMRIVRLISRLRIEVKRV